MGFRVRGVGFGVWGLGSACGDGGGVEIQACGVKGAFAGIQGARQGFRVPGLVPIPLAVSFDTGFRRRGFGSAFVSMRHVRLALVRLASSWRLGATLYPRP